MSQPNTTPIKDRNGGLAHSATPKALDNQVDTHNVLLEFGKHKGERWTRVPLSYLKWILNEMSPDQTAYKYAESELNRRGDTMPAEVEISNHAIDKASLRVRKAWHADRGKDEGLYSWLVRISEEALAIKNKENEQNERVNYKGCKLVFTYGNFFPTLKTILNDKSYSLSDKAQRLATDAKNGIHRVSDLPNIKSNQSKG